jgi:hypothetical protein
MDQLEHITPLKSKVIDQFQPIQLVQWSVHTSSTSTRSVRTGLGSRRRHRLANVSDRD